MNDRTKGITVFLAMAFGFGWGWLLLARLVLRLSLVNPLVQLPFAMLPAVAAVVVRRWVTREGFRDAGLALRWRRAWPSYLAAWFGPLLLTAAALGLAALLGHRPDFTRLAGLAPGLPSWSAPLLLAVVATVLTPLYWGEEFGWSGYLRLRLLPGRPMLSVLVTGLLWACWHYPLAMLGYLHLGSLAAGLPLWTATFLCQECLLAWLRARSGSIWPPALAHAGNNMVLSLLVSQLLSGTGLGDLALTLLPVPALALCAYATTRGLRRSAAAPAAG
ncbi:CPBP family intramembrane metalloprotease [Kitasatospora acidiphila]|uniref:CPBP family intramembrane metalloprotease n=1 Tax=Kitasatospora acidiphila TaxID=2567942 RepID=A0A540WFY2_9ACTN|nr:CPBP family intramembrane glutamic endopeptidase [Kitasatospora acidiphila]TQF07925.1 CPBP family intramembrane metalloprotease [Kitasatospora acidiphila]